MYIEVMVDGRILWKMRTLKVWFFSWSYMCMGHSIKMVHMGNSQKM